MPVLPNGEARGRQESDTSLMKAQLYRRALIPENGDRSTESEEQGIPALDVNMPYDQHATLMP